MAEWMGLVVARNYPYAVAPNRISILFDKILKASVPDKVTQQWLATVGLKSKNDRLLPSILKHIGFIDSAGVPTTLWNEYRGSSPKLVIAKAIRQGYSDLFGTYPSAHELSDEELTAFFRGNTKQSDIAVKRIVQTFKALVSLADFREIDSESLSVENTSASSARDGLSRELGNTITFNRSRDIAINVNLQLTLPESKDPSVYDALFASLKKHILEE